MTLRESVQTAQTIYGPTLYPTILLYGGTGAGKTAQIGELAEYYFKKSRKITRFYNTDKGGADSIRPYIALGVIEEIPLFGNPWIWLDHAVKGNKLDGNGKWVPGVDDNVALYAYDGMTSHCDAVMDWMKEAAGKGVSIGGGAAVNFTVQEGTEKLRIGSSNMTHYKVAQDEIYNKATQSMSLPGTVLWTAGDKRGEDDAVGGVVGPQTAGKAQTGEVPRWFKYTFRIATEVEPMQPTKHVLYTDAHMELQSKGGAKGIANARVPLSGQSVQIPAKIEPASLVTVLELLERRQGAAKDDIKRRLGL